MDCLDLLVIWFFEWSSNGYKIIVRFERLFSTICHTTCKREILNHCKHFLFIRCIIISKLFVRYLQPQFLDYKIHSRKAKLICSIRNTRKFGIKRTVRWYKKSRKLCSRNAFCNLTRLQCTVCVSYQSPPAKCARVMENFNFPNLMKKAQPAKLIRRTD